MEKDKITTCISTNNNLNYLKLAIQSVRKNCFYKNQPIVIHAENCTDGTDDWLFNNKNKLNLTVYIDHNTCPKGIGGGMNFCVDKAETEFINIIHSDMWVAPNQDIELLKLYENLDPAERLISSSFRIQPKIFQSDPDYRPGTIFLNRNDFGEFHHNFKYEQFDKWAKEFSELNDKTVRKGGGAGFFCKKEDYVYIGGNDPLFSPASFEDMDLFIRMQNEGYQFKMTSKSVVYHFSARGSHFKNDDLTETSERQIKAEQNNIHKFINKWGSVPQSDKDTFVLPIKNENVKNIMNFKENLKN
jgi:GT2 family glycosyltransferase